MKKFLILSSSPFLLILVSFWFIFVESVIGFTHQVDSTVYEYCKGSEELETCVLENSQRYYDYVKVLNRKSFSKDKSARGAEDDRGGCDLLTLRRLTFVQDKKPRRGSSILQRGGVQISEYEYDFQKQARVKYWIDVCSDEASLRLYLKFKGKTHPSQGKKSFEDLISTLEPPEKLLERENFGTVKSNSLHIGTLLMTIAPYLLIIFLAFRYRTHIFPQKNEKITEWLNSQKKFRIAIVLSLVWASIFFLSITTTIEYEDMLRDPILSFFLLFSQFYPLLLVVITKYISSAEN